MSTGTAAQGRTPAHDLEQGRTPAHDLELEHAAGRPRARAHMSLGAYVRAPASSTSTDDSSGADLEHGHDLEHARVRGRAQR